MFIKTAKDICQVVISDTHSCSNFALFLGCEWHGKKTSHVPRAKQIEIRKHFLKFVDAVREQRKGKPVRLIHNGDAIDGDHHNSGDVCTRDPLEQAEVHIEIMQELQKLIGWQRGDEIYYTRGTQSHVNEMENYIGREMNAVMCGDYYVHDLLQLETNGIASWFVHHGPGRGVGANEGNGLRNWLKAIYYDSKKDGTECPDVIYTGHVHDPTYAVYERRAGMDFKLMHGIILPSWQSKTSYGWQVAPVAREKIGGVIHEIKADGTITTPKFCVMGY